MAVAPEPLPDTPPDSERPGAEGESPRRSARGGRVAAAAAAVGLCAAALTVAVLTRSGEAPPTPVAANSIGLIDPNGGQVRRQFEVGQAPTSVAVGGGAVWAANAMAGTVSRIDPVSRAVQTITVGSSPAGIVAGGGGVWVANHDDDTVSWINPQSNTIVRTITVGAQPTAMAYGYGSVWVTNVGDRTVTRIDTETGATKTIRANVVGRGITVGGGSVWVTDEATRSVVQIDPSTGTIISTGTVGTGPIGIAYGDGSLWVANSLDDTVSRLDATTLAETARIPVAGGPSAVGFTDGSVWVSAEFGSRVVRIDPRQGVTVGSTPIGNRPEGLASGDGGLWVAVQARGDGHRGGRLVSLNGVPTSIDPAFGPVLSVSGADPAYETLTSQRDVGGAAGTQIVPNLAAALPLPTAGGTRYTFRLRAGIRYSDGRPLRAVDFRRAVARALELRDRYTVSRFGDLAGAVGCIRHRRCDLSRSVVVAGPSTLTFQLPAPNPHFFTDLSRLVPVPAGTSMHDVGTKPVPSTGPYAIDAFAPGRVLTLVRNRYFHVWSSAARPDGYPDEIVNRSVRSPDEAVRDVLAGKADIVTAFNQTARFEDVAVRHPLQMHSVPQHGTVFVFLNVERRPFDDVRVRRALNYAVDRRRVSVLHGAAFARPTCQVVPPTVPGYRPYCPYTVEPGASGDWTAPDLTKARALIRASGTRGQTVVVWSTAVFRRESVYLVGLLRHLGYQARLHYIEDWNAYAAALDRNTRAQAGFIGWFGDELAAGLARRRRVPRPGELGALLRSAHRRTGRTPAKERIRRPRAYRRHRRVARSRDHGSGALGPALHPGPRRRDIRARRQLPGLERRRPARPALGPLAPTRPSPALTFAPRG